MKRTRAIQERKAEISLDEEVLQVLRSAYDFDRALLQLEERFERELGGGTNGFIPYRMYNIFEDRPYQVPDIKLFPNFATYQLHLTYIPPGIFELNDIWLYREWASSSKKSFRLSGMKEGQREEIIVDESDEPFYYDKGQIECVPLVAQTKRLVEELFVWDRGVVGWDREVRKSNSELWGIPKKGKITMRDADLYFVKLGRFRTKQEKNEKRSER